MLFVNLTLLWCFCICSWSLRPFLEHLRAEGADVAAVRVPNQAHPAVPDRFAHCSASGSVVAGSTTGPHQVLLCLLYASRCGRGWRLQWSRPCSQHRHCSGTPERPKAHPPTIRGLVSSSRAHHCDIVLNRRRLPKRHPGSCIDLFGFDVMFDTALKPYALRSNETLASFSSLSFPHQCGLPGWTDEHVDLLTSNLDVQICA